MSSNPEMSYHLCTYGPLVLNLAWDFRIFVLQHKILFWKRLAVANKHLNETSEVVGDIKTSSQRRWRLIYSLVRLYRPTLVTNYSNSDFTTSQQFIENLDINCVVKRLVVVTFKSCDRDVICL